MTQKHARIGKRAREDIPLCAPTTTLPVDQIESIIGNVTCATCLSILDNIGAWQCRHGHRNDESDFECRTCMLDIRKKMDDATLAMAHTGSMCIVCGVDTSTQGRSSLRSIDEPRYLGELGTVCTTHHNILLSVLEAAGIEHIAYEALRTLEHYTPIAQRIREESAEARNAWYGSVKVGK